MIKSVLVMFIDIAMRSFKIILLLIMCGNFGFCEVFDAGEIDSDFINPDIMIEYLHAPVPRNNIPGYLIVLNPKKIDDESIEIFLDAAKLNSRSYVLINTDNGEIISWVVVPVKNNMVKISLDNRVVCLVEREIFYRHISGQLRINWDKWKNLELVEE